MKKKINWYPLFFSNFLGVLNDNILKNLICFISIYWIAKDNESIIIMLATGFMVLPYILFSPYAGFLSKTVKKQKIVFFAKFTEIPIMLIAITGFYFENIYIVMASMFFMGLQSSIYSPAKYGLIRDIGGKERISYGTGSIEMLTFLGVLIGTFLAGVLSDLEDFRLLIISLTVISIAISGFISGWLIKAKESKPLQKSIKPFNSINFVIRNYKWSKINTSGLNYIVLGLSSFWLIGSLIQMNMLIHCPQTLGMSNTSTGIVMALVAVSIGLGAWLSGIISRKKVELGLISIGGIGLATFNLLIFIINPNGIFFIILIMLAAFSAGIMKIPMNAWIQTNIKGRKLGDSIAYNNLMNFVFILISAGLFGFIETTFNTRVVFMMIAIFACILTIFLSLKLTGIKESINQLFKFIDNNKNK